MSWWRDLAILLVGAILIWQSRIEYDYIQYAYPDLPALLLAAGAIMVVWGIRGVARWLWQRPERIRKSGAARRYRVRLQTEAWIYVVILLVLCLGALLGKSNILLLVFGLMAGPFVLGGQITLLVLNRLQVERELPDHAVAGQKFAVRVRLANRKPLLSAWMIVASDTLAGARAKLKPSVLFTRIPPRQQREAAYAVCPAERGKYRVGPMRVSCGFPFGLVERSFELGQVEELVVFPRMGRIVPAWYAAYRQGRQAVDRALPRGGVLDEEFHRLREYRGGDNPRSIHWRTTARRNELMVREYEHHREPTLCLVLDLWQPQSPTPGEFQRVELAVSLAATLCAEQSRGGGDARIHLVISGAELSRMSGTGSELALRELLGTLSLAQAGPSTQLAAALREASAAQWHDMRRVLISTRPDPTAACQGDLPDADFEVIEASPTALAEIFIFDGLTEQPKP
ncbi:MAG: DUF58 domain-containing protein [Planctomycetales bacterium]